ncbi:alpha/beta fold hydrolase [Dyella monticola]|uniref:Alpha/beta fold hydrolase n=1 Tax=Dyella monticola TaxID=1927958 RepID=A0A370X9L8_9GAMM|nr:alpha/beta fold hydrolase [Dyella monticola]RDS84992.1 alpha/beta fold hydrolase [Dyella monticola]
MSVVTADGARSELICVEPRVPPLRALYWLSAMGVPAKHYLPLAEAFAAQGIAVALHEWRGIGSSDRRASRREDWGYRQCLQWDLPAGIAQARARWPGAEWWLGGHSLGGQLACLYASMHRDEVSGLALVASGSPYWRCFAYGAGIYAAYALVNPLSRLLGYLPGRRIGFGGNEARGLIADWSRSGRTGRYGASGLSVDFEQRLAQIHVPVLALSLRDDWLAPPASLNWLLDKMPAAPRRTAVIAPDQLDGRRADHFSWMKVPGGVARLLGTWMAGANT